MVRIYLPFSAISDLQQHSSDPQIPLTMPKKWSSCRFSVLPNDYLITER
jgi:hypothetical protein